MKAENSERLERERTFKEIAATANKTAKQPATKAKVVSRKVVVRKRKADDFWINIGVVVVIGLCLMVIGWEVLQQLV
ncbi:hypothetical protein ACO1PK_00620 [Alishewanella sp. d11]|uniref:hypothetical protein n=1 Tax=Alishewanella sp. d11 TaxID=3414030 RepID=UPI003BF8DDE4